MKEIGEYAFYLCDNLENIYVGNSIETIGASAFWNNWIMTNVYIDSIEYWFSIDGMFNLGSEEWSLFVDKKYVDVLVIPETATEIPHHAFFRCMSINKVVIPASVKTIGREAFMYCENLSVVEFADGLETIENNAFRESGVVSIELPDTVTTLELGVFNQCKKLKSVKLPANIELIPQYAFYACPITSIIIPETVTEIQSNAFNKCEKLKTVYNLSELNIEKGKTTYGYVGKYAENVYTELVED